MQFFLKKLVAGMLMPVALAVELVVAGLILVRFTRRPKTGKALVAVGIGILIVFGSTWVPAILVERLESTYPTFRLSEESGGTAYVVVLGQSFAPAAENVPFTSQVTDVVLTRLMEGVRVARLLEDPPILVSLGGLARKEEMEAFVDQFAELVGMERERFELTRGAVDTASEIRAVRELAGDRKVVLVTSASHMRRAMLVCARLGVAAIPAPCGHLAKPEVKDPEGEAPLSPSWLFPDARNLYLAETAVHEYLGLAWEWVAGLRARAGRERL